MIILIDNYDSFSYNLYQMIGEMDPDIEVFRNDAITAEEVLKKEPKAVILSPGPGKPSEAGICEEVVKICAGRIPILGVCLGHQAICEAFGAMIVHARELMHGKQSIARLSRWSLLFKGLPDKTRVARYHSLAVRPDTLPKALRVSAVAEDGEIMAVEHERAPIFGLQFHPESIMTPDGRVILKNFLAIADSFPRKAKGRVIMKEVQPFKPPVLKREAAKTKEKPEEINEIKEVKEAAAKEVPIKEEVVKETPAEETAAKEMPVKEGAAKEKLVIKEAIVRLVNKENLDAEAAERSMDEIMDGKAGQVLVSSFLTALQTKGATGDEIAACARSMRGHALSFKHDHEVFEITGIGGDRNSRFNISLAVSMILAAAGEKVTRHGRRAGGARAGTADCLEKLGVNTSLEPEKLVKIFEKTNMAFLPDYTYFPSMKYAAPVRKELPVPTIFDMLGAFTAPSYPTKQLLGVFREDMLVPMTHVLESLGVKRAMTVFGQDIFDKVSLSAPTSVCELKDGQYQTYMIKPEDFGFERCDSRELAGGGPEVNAEIIRSILGGEKGHRRDVVLLNAGAALHVAREISIAEGILVASEILDSGRAKAWLEEFARATNEESGQ